VGFIQLAQAPNIRLIIIKSLQTTFWMEDSNCKQKR